MRSGSPTLGGGGGRRGCPGATWTDLQTAPASATVGRSPLWGPSLHILRSVPAGRARTSASKGNCGEQQLLQRARSPGLWQQLFPGPQGPHSCCRSVFGGQTRKCWRVMGWSTLALWAIPKDQGLQEWLLRDRGHRGSLTLPWRGSSQSCLMGKALGYTEPRASREAL